MSLAFAFHLGHLRSRGVVSAAGPESIDRRIRRVSAQSFATAATLSTKSIRRLLVLRRSRIDRYFWSSCHSDIVQLPEGKWLCPFAQGLGEYAGRVQDDLRTLELLREFIAAIDRRLPQIARAGEAAIAAEAARLRTLAAERIAEIEGATTPRSKPL